MIRVTHYSDALCVWAYIAQIRMQELESNFSDDIEIEYRFMPVFGDVAGKMQQQWSDRGGIDAYAAHVQEVAEGFPHIQLAPRVWLDNTPTSSLPAHLVLCGVKASQDMATAQKLLRLLRQAFFVELKNISQQAVLLDVAEQCGCDMDALRARLEDGTAHAQLAADIAAARDNGVRSSPTLMLNEGRQTLAGNVGYRVIEANIRELLENPSEQQSWC
jgi:predicted DsbA family dithiol-disulfide isomerase